jgi:methylglyoxal synthase
MGHRVGVIPQGKRKTEKKRIALIAHDAKKVDIVMLAEKYKEKLSQCNLIATGITGKTIKEKTGLDVTRMHSGPDGGDLQIGGLVASDEVDMVVFLRDPLTAQPHDPDVSALLRVCDVHNVPLATNLASAEVMFKGL